MRRTKIFESWIKLMAWFVSKNKLSDEYQSLFDSVLKKLLLYPRLLMNRQLYNVKCPIKYNIGSMDCWVQRTSALFLQIFEVDWYWILLLCFNWAVYVLLRWWMWYAYRLSPVLRLVDPSGFQVQYSHQRNHVTRSAKAVPRLIYVTIIPKWLSISSHIRTKLTSLEFTLLLLIDYS